MVTWSLPIPLVVVGGATALLLMAWGLAGTIVLVAARNRLASLRTEATAAKNSVFEYQTQYEQVFEKAYPSSSAVLGIEETLRESIQDAKAEAVEPNSLSTASDLSSGDGKPLVPVTTQAAPTALNGNEPRPQLTGVNLPQVVQPRAVADWRIPRPIKATTTNIVAPALPEPRRATAPAVEERQGEPVEGRLPLDAAPADTARIPDAAAVEPEVPKDSAAAITAAYDIQHVNADLKGRNLTIRFDLVNQDAKARSQSGFVWIIAAFKTAEGDSRTVVAPAGVPEQPISGNAAKRGDRFRFKRQRATRLTLEAPGEGEGRFTSAQIVVANVQGKIVVTKMVAVPQAVVAKRPVTPPVSEPIQIETL